jgi:hypothetical protein
MDSLWILSDKYFPVPSLKDIIDIKKTKTPHQSPLCSHYHNLILWTSSIHICSSALAFLSKVISTFLVCLQLWLLRVHFFKVKHVTLFSSVTFNFLIILLLYWEYIVAFTKVLIIYNSWIHPSSFCLNSLFPFLE